MTTFFPSDQPRACTGPESALVPGRLRGFRRWTVRLSAPPLGLHALRGEGPAWNGEMTAGCFGGRKHDAPAPSEGCYCGIYAWYRPDLIDGLDGSCPCGCGVRLTYGASTTGVIEASGRVLLGTRGFRAERARIVAVVVEPEHALVGAMLEQRGVPTFPTLAQLLDAFPPQDDLASLGIDVDQISPPADPTIDEAMGGLARYFINNPAPASGVFAELSRAAEQMRVAQERLARRRREQLAAMKLASEDAAVEMQKFLAAARDSAEIKPSKTGPPPRGRAPKRIDPRGDRR